MNSAKEALNYLSRARLEEPSASMLQAFQNGFLGQLKKRKHRSGLESAELAGLRAMLKVMLEEIDSEQNAYNRQQSVVTQNPQTGKDNKYHSEISGC